MGILLFSIGLFFAFTSITMMAKLSLSKKTKLQFNDDGSFTVYIKKFYA